MAYNKEDYIKVKKDYFLQGMFVEGEVYMINKDVPVLLCLNCIITKDILDRLGNYEEVMGFLYVEKDVADGIIQQYEYFSKNESYILGDYVKNEEQVKEIFDEVYASGALSSNKSQRLSKQIQTMIDFVDASLLVQCTTYLRDTSEYLYQHSMSVALINGLMAKWLNLPKKDSERLILAGLLHDIGKVKIPISILDKPSKLTEEEYRIVKLHPLFSVDLLQDAGIGDEEVYAAVRGHHEKMNGAGYPDGLVGSQLSLFTKITTISDIYDAMVAKRTYKEAVSPLEVLDLFAKQKYSELDIELVEIFLDMMADEFRGKRVILSDGSFATIKFIDKKQFMYPLVQVNDKVIQLNKDLRCVAICD